MMNNDLLLQLYQQKDRKRKRILFDLFSSVIQMNTSLSFIAEMINKELGQENLITEGDIKYCRHYFLGKIKPSPSKLMKPNNAIKPVDNQANISKAIVWTNPDDNDFNFRQPIKSKFSKS